MTESFGESEWREMKYLIIHWYNESSQSMSMNVFGK